MLGLSGAYADIDEKVGPPLISPSPYNLTQFTCTSFTHECMHTRNTVTMYSVHVLHGGMITTFHHMHSCCISSSSVPIMLGFSINTSQISKILHARWTSDSNQIDSVMFETYLKPRTSKDLRAQSRTFHLVCSRNRCVIWLVMFRHGLTCVFVRDPFIAECPFSFTQFFNVSSSVFRSYPCHLQLVLLGSSVSFSTNLP